MQHVSIHGKPAPTVPVVFTKPVPVVDTRQTERVGAPYLVALLTPRTPSRAVPSTRTTPSTQRRKCRPSEWAWNRIGTVSPPFHTNRSKKRSTSALLSSEEAAVNNRKRTKLVHGSKSRKNNDSPSASLAKQPSGACTRRYEAAMAHCALSSPSRLRKSLDLLREMQCKGIRPSAQAYHGLVSACVDNGQTSVARSILNRMMQLRTENDRRGDHRIYNALIKLCMKLKDVDMAFGLINLMEQSSAVRITTGSIDILLKVCNRVGNKGHVMAAAQLFGRLKAERGMKADRMLIDTMLQICFSNQVYTNTLELCREAITIGRYKPFPLGTPGTMCIWDLHGLFERDACFLLAEAFDRAAVLASQGVSRDIVIVTGKGFNSSGAPVLREKIPQFLSTVVGLKVTRLKDNEGRFLITGSSLQEWASGSRYSHFIALFGPTVQGSEKTKGLLLSGVAQVKRPETREEKQKRRLLAWRCKFAQMKQSGKLRL